MSLVTRCPRCTTLFRVTPVQLQARAGKVRCGRCMNVFDGFKALSVEQADSVSEPVQFESDVSVTRPEAPAPPIETAPASASTSERKTAPVPPNQTALPSREPLESRAREYWAGTRSGAGTRLLRKPSATFVWTIACVLAGIFLVAQVAYAYRSELVARYPGMKALVTGVCEVTGCSVGLPYKHDLVKIEASDVQMIDANRPQLMQLTATLRSYASYYLAYPALDLVLTNANEHALARRIFIPQEYLDKSRDPQVGIAPNAEITIALDLDIGDLNAAGFRLDLLPSPR